MSGAPAIPAGGTSFRCVVFRAGGERFALALERVRAVVLPQPPFARVPRSGSAVKGAMNLRGRIVPVVDLARLLGLPLEPLGDRDGQVLILEGERSGVGLLVAAVLGVEALEPGSGSPGSEPGQVIASCGAGAVTLLDAPVLVERAASQFGIR